MKRITKVIVVVGIILVVVGLSGTAITFVSISSMSERSSISSSDTTNPFVEKRQKLKTYKWIALTGVLISSSARLIPKLKAKR
jgi:hypothetical protein